MTILFRNPNSFLTGNNPFIRTQTVETGNGIAGSEINFENHHEGLIGIPHGGVAMGLCLDVWRNLKGPQYPVNVSYRFAGSGISIGERALLEVEPETGTAPGSLAVRMTKPGDRKPYLRAVFSRSEGAFPETVEALPPDQFRLLPFYRNCLVCGHSRSVVGLERQFRYHESEVDKVVTVAWGDKDEDFDRAKYFLFDEDELHPLVLIAMFDENTAWGGFMETKRGGLSVKLDFSIKRPVRSDEKLVFTGRASGIRGAASSPRFFSARGQILSISDPKSPELVASGWGEWVVLSQYTEQIKKNLIPVSDLEWIFG